MDTTGIVQQKQSEGANAVDLAACVSLSGLSVDPRLSPATQPWAQLPAESAAEGENQQNAFQGMGPYEVNPLSPTVLDGGMSSTRSWLYPMGEVL